MNLIKGRGQKRLNYRFIKQTSILVFFVIGLTTLSFFLTKYQEVRPSPASAMVSAASTDLCTAEPDHILNDGENTYDGTDIAITNCAFVINGTHSFVSVTIGDGVGSADSSLTHDVSTTSTMNTLDLTVTNDFTILGDGVIDVSSKGFLGAAQPGNGNDVGRTFGNTTTGGSGDGAGASYGGAGGGFLFSGSFGPANELYGDYKNPLYVGSGGGGSGASGIGGNGGGLVRLTVGGTLSIGGPILSNGGNGTGSLAGGGSGGGIYLNAATIQGTASVTANGGDAKSDGFWGIGGGGGGRIAFLSTTKTYSGTVRAYGGPKTTGGNSISNNGGGGSIFYKSGGQTNGQLIIDNDKATTPIFDTRDYVSTRDIFRTYLSTSTGLSSTVLTDSAASFIINGLTGLQLNPNLNQTTSFPITSNTATTITVSGDMTTVASSSDTYGVYHNALDDLTIKGQARASIENGPLTITTVNLQNTAYLTHRPSTTVLTPSAITITATNVTLDAGTSMDVSARGYLGGNVNGNGTTGRTLGNTDTGGSVSPSGGSYGGLGGTFIQSGTSYFSNDSYGDPKNPNELGSGGGSGNAAGRGGNGGGLISLNVSGTATINGSLLANGDNASTSGGAAIAGGGSGGGIYLSAGTVTGGGSISANGGNAVSDGFWSDGGGGGGRIAIISATNSFAGTVSAIGGNKTSGGNSSSFNGGAGTVFKQNTGNGDLFINNGGVVPDVESTKILSGILLDNLTVQGAARAVLLEAETISNTLTVDNAILSHQASGSNQISVTDLVLQNGATLTHSPDTSSAEYHLNINASGNATINSGTSIDVSSRGYLGGQQPGNPSGSGFTLGNSTTGGSPGVTGGSYGGRGGNFNATQSAESYGSFLNPNELGSGGGIGSAAGIGGNGGGLARLTVGGTLTVDGSILANGGNATSSGGAALGGGGAGGGIYLSAGTITGGGPISSIGGNAITDGFWSDGGGGGGRVAVYYTINNYNGTISVYGGLQTGGGNSTADDGSSGTLFLKGSGDTYGDLSLNNNNIVTAVITPLFVSNPATTNYTIRNLAVTNLAKLGIGSPCSTVGNALTVTGTQDFSGGGQVIDQSGLTCTVSYAPLSITTLSLPSAIINQFYSQTLQSTGGIAPLTWSCRSGGSPVACVTVLPPGISLNAGTGEISGTPTILGSYPFTARLTDGASNFVEQAYTLDVNPPDITPPTISEVTPVTNPTNDNTPNYTFTTDEAGTINYGGDCSSATASAVVGNNTITFNTLADGLHNNCTIVVTDASSNPSTPLSVSAFTVDTAAPTVSQVTPVSTPTNDNTPDYTFNTTEAGTITYGGDCSSATTSAVSGNNTVTFSAMAVGLHNNCTIAVTDAANNTSSLLSVSPFTITPPPSGGGVSHVPPDAPTTGIGEAQSNKTIRWNLTDNASNETGFRIMAGDTVVADSAIQNLTYLDEDPTENTLVSGRVPCAYNSFGTNCSASQYPPVYTLIDPPVGLTFSNITSDSVTLKAEGTLPNLDQGQSGVYFEIVSGTNSGWINQTSYTFTGLQADTNYTFRVKARNGDMVETNYVPGSISTLAANAPQFNLRLTVGINRGAEVGAGINGAGLTAGSGLTNIGSDIDYLSASSGWATTALAVLSLTGFISLVSAIQTRPKKKLKGAKSKTKPSVGHGLLVQTGEANLLAVLLLLIFKMTVVVGLVVYGGQISAQVAFNDDGSEVHAGDVLTYRLDYQNIGPTTAHNMVVQAPIPNLTNYVPGSMNWSGAAQTDAADNDSGTANGSAVNFSIGQVSANEAGYVLYHVAVSTQPDQDTAITNQESVTYSENPSVINSSRASNPIRGSGITPPTPTPPTPNPNPPTPVPQPTPTPPSPQPTPTPGTPGPTPATPPGPTPTPGPTPPPVAPSNGGNTNVTTTGNSFNVTYTPAAGSGGSNLVVTGEYQKTSDGGYSFAGMTSEPGTTVYLSVEGQNFSTVSDANGHWGIEVSGNVINEIAPAGGKIIARLQAAKNGEASDTVTVAILTPTPVRETVTSISIPPAIAQTIAAVGATARQVEPQTQAGLVAIVPIFAVANPTIALNLPNIGAFLYHFLNWLAATIGIKKKRKPWGTVYNSITKEPVSLAIIRLFRLSQLATLAGPGAATEDFSSAQGPVLVETQVTDSQGRFGFLPREGTYRLEVTKPGYNYPSNIVNGSADGEFENIYKSQPFKISGSNQSITASVPVDPLNPAEEKKSAVQRGAGSNFWYNVKRLSQKLSLPMLIIGLIFSLIITLADFNAINIGIFVLYVLFAAFQIIFSPKKQKPWGVVYDTDSLKPVPLAVVNIFDTQYNRLLKTRLTDYEGRFSFLPPTGKYKILVQKPGYQFPSRRKEIKAKFQNNYYGNDFEVTKNKEVIDIDVPIDRAGG